jgi:2-oxoglutarate ferredoxin oxidoreductase subunit gamma
LLNRASSIQYPASNIRHPVSGIQDPQFALMVGEMGKRYEVRFSGTGGQGVVLAGIILAEAAGSCKGQFVVQTVSYGPQVRGGMSSAEVVISDQEIDYPKPMRLDLLVPFTQEACDQGAGLMKPDGVILLDPDLVVQTPEGWVASIPMTRLAKEVTGRAQMANIVALGAIACLAPFLEPADMEAAVRERAPRGLEDRFVEALGVGQQAAEEIREKIAYETAPSPDD